MSATQRRATRVWYSQERGLKLIVMSRYLGRQDAGLLSIAFINHYGHHQTATCIPPSMMAFVPIHVLVEEILRFVNLL